MMPVVSVILSLFQNQCNKGNRAICGAQARHDLEV